MNRWIVVLLLSGASLTSAQVQVENVESSRELTAPTGPDAPSQRVRAMRPPRIEERRIDTTGFRIFGAHTGAMVGLTAMAALASQSSGDAGAAVGATSLMLAAGGAVLMHRLAREHEWNPRVGGALAGFYPGLAYGISLGLLAAVEADLSGRARIASILGTAAVTTVISMTVFSRLEGDDLRRGVGFFYLLAGVAALVALPFAVAWDRPLAPAWAAAGGGALGLVLAGARAYRW